MRGQPGRLPSILLDDIGDCGEFTIPGVWGVDRSVSDESGANDGEANRPGSLCLPDVEGEKGC